MDITQVEIEGPCRLTFKGVDIGHTLDGIVLTVDRSFADVLVDRYGSMPIDKVLTGVSAKLKFKLAQFNVRNFDIAMPETSTYDGAVGDRADIGADAGYSLRADAGLLVIHPLKYAVGDLSHDINIYRAVNTNTMELSYKIDEQLAVEVEMEALVDESFGTGRRLGHIGTAIVS